MVRTPLLVLAAGAITVAVGAHQPKQENSNSPLPGFTAPNAAVERDVERRFLGIPSADRAREAHAYLTAEPHVAGTPRDRVLADWVAARWREYGLEQVAITEHQVLLPYPIEATIEMTAPTHHTATLHEDPVPGDPFSAREIPPAYHVYTPSGDVTAPVVYANSGNPADYDWLIAHGVDVKGKIALVRYSVPYSYRGFKALTAQRYGAAALLIYSDPADDGYGKGEVYPKGPWGPDSHLQRGGTVYDFNVPGDPLTPGWPSLPGERRIKPEEAVSLPKIMSSPLSWRDARVILAALGGPESPAAWKGGLPITYHAGAGPATVHMRLKMDDAVRPIWTVTAQLTGAAHPDEKVILGNHRDAWVYGGVDPSSGTASMMELARAFGTLAREGIKPKRTIVFANWDAEEFTLTSSTEWGEEHAADLAKNGVAYLNVDSSTSGPTFTATAVASLNGVIAGAASSVTDPNTGKSVADAWRSAKRGEASALPGGSGDEMIANRLGSGSDYTVFLNHLGMPVADLSFDGPYGVYHSIYDNHAWMSKFGDPTFGYHAAMAKLWGIAAMRLANADVVPLDFRPYAIRLRDFAADVQKSSAGDSDLAAPLMQAIARFAASADRASRDVDAALAAAPPDAARLQARSKSLIAVERAFLGADGIPGRPWYRHLIYAPKPTYAAEVFPGVTEALDQHDLAKARQQLERAASAIDLAAAVLDGRSPGLR